MMPWILSHDEYVNDPYADNNPNMTRMPGTCLALSIRFGGGLVSGAVKVVSASLL